MSKFIQASDFKTDNRYSITVNIEQGQALQDYVDTCESTSLRDLLGDRLYNALIADLDVNNDPQSEKWIDFVNGVTYTPVDDLDLDVIYLGIIEMLKGFCYFDYSRDNQTRHTGIGVRKLRGENSEQPGQGQMPMVLISKYNRAIDLYHAAQCFLFEYESRTVEAQSYSEVAGTYTFNTTDTKYLQVGDVVTIESEEYTVTAVVAGVSFDFVAATGLTFTNLNLQWYPFEFIRSRTVIKEPATWL